MPTFETVATIVRIPSTVVLSIGLWGYGFFLLRHLIMSWFTMLYSETALIARKIILLPKRTHQSSCSWKEVMRAREEAAAPVAPFR